MFKLYFAIFVLAFLCFIEYKKYKHLLAATVVYPIMWILSLAGVIIKGNEYYEIGWTTVLVIILGYVLFILGFSLVMNRKKGSSLKKKVNCTDESYKQENIITESTIQDNIGNQLVGLNLIIIISLGITVLAVVTGLKYIDFDDVLGSLSKIKMMIDVGEKPFPYIVVVSRYFLRCAIWYLSLIYFRIPKENHYRTMGGYSYKSAVLLRLILVTLMAFIVMFTDVSRNDILMTLLPVLFNYVLARKLSNVKIIVLAAGCFVVFLLIFTVFMYFRGGLPEDFFNDESGVRQEKITYYLSGTIPAIDQLYKKNKISLITLDGENGRYTLSLLTALSDGLFSTKLKPEVLQGFICIGTNSYINVFTYYHWLGMDFGLLYAAAFNILLGILYAALYKRVKNSGLGATFCYSVLSYPLCMMFFEDQFLAIGQTWLIIAGFSYIIFFICNTSRIKAGYYNSYKWQKTN